MTAVLAGYALLAPLLAALLLAPPWLRRRGRLAAALSILAATASLGCALLVLLDAIRLAPLHEHAFEQRMEATWLASAGRPLAVLGTHVDELSAVMLVVVCLVALAVQVFSLGYLADEPPPALGRYYACHSLFLFSMGTLVLAPNMLQAFLGWELVGASSFLLIGFWWRKASAARAALKAFWMTRLADVGFIVAIIVMRVQGGSFEWDAVRLSDRAHGAVALLLFLAIMGKSAQVPLHVWLPDAMEGPTPVSALLHAATMVAAGVFLVVRAWPLFHAAPGVLVLMAHVGALTALLAACVALVQDDIKRVLAYSTCSQLGFMFAALGSGDPFAGFFHLATHAFFKALLFLAAGAVIHAVHSNLLGDMGGLGRRMRLTTTLFVLGALALAGIPPLSGFFSKDAILEAVVHRGHPFVIGALFATVLLTAFYMTRVVVLAFLGPPSRHVEHAGVHEAGPSLLAPLVALAIPAAVLGLLAGPLSRLLRFEHRFHAGAVGLVALALAAAGVALGVIVFGRRRAPAAAAALAPLGVVARSGAIDRAWLLGYRHAMLGVARVSAWIDRYVIDALMNVVGWATIEGGQRLRPLQTGRVADYAWVLLIAVAVLAAFGAMR